MSDIQDLVSDPSFQQTTPEKQQAILSVFFHNKVASVPQAANLDPGLLEQTRQAFVQKFMPPPTAKLLGGDTATLSAPATPAGPKVTLPFQDEPPPSMLQKATNYVKQLPSSISEGFQGGLGTLKDAALQAATAALPSLPKIDPSQGNVVLQAAKQALAPVTDSLPAKIAQKQVADEQKYETIQEGLQGKPLSTAQKLVSNALRATFLGGLEDRSNQQPSLKNNLLDILDIAGTAGGLAEVLGPAKAIQAANLVKNVATVAPKIGMSAEELGLLGQVADKLSEVPGAAEVLKGSMPAAETAAEAAPAAAEAAPQAAGLPVMPKGSSTEGKVYALLDYIDPITGEPNFKLYGNTEGMGYRTVPNVPQSQLPEGVQVVGRTEKAAQLGHDLPGGEAAGGAPPSSGPEVSPAPGGPAAPPTPPEVPSPGGTPPAGGGGIGQFNIDRFQDPQVRQILTDAQKDIDVQSQIIAQKRGVISDDQLKSLADKVDLTPEELQKMAPGTVLNAESLYKANQSLGAISKGMATMADKYRAAKAAGDATAVAAITADSTRLMDEFTKTFVNVRAVSSELGRALRQQRITIDSMTPAARQLLGDSVEGGLFDPSQMGGILDKLGALGPDENAIANALSQQLKPTLTSRIVNIATSLKLSSPVTLLRHNLGNALATITRFGEKGMQGPIDMLRSTFTGTPRERFAAEAGGYLFGLGQGMQDGMKAFMARLLESTPSAGGIPAEGMTTQRFATLPGLPGKVLSASSRVLEAGDQFFQTILHRGELYSVALRKASQEGLQMSDRWGRVQELIANPTEDMLNAAEAVAKEYNYKNPLGPATELLDKMRNTFGGLPKLLVPFFRTPVNVGKFIIQRSPLALIPVPTARFWPEIMAGGGTAVDAVSRVTLGSAIQAAMVDMALKGYVTGGGPKSKAERDLLTRQGWQPYSFHIGDKYYSYQLFDPLTFGAAADIAEAWTQRKEAPSTDLVMAASLSVVKNLVNQPFLKTVHDVIQSVQDERGAGKFLDAFAGGMVPAGVGLVAKVEDPTVRAPKGVLQSVEARIPGLSTNVPPRMNVFGEPIQREGTFPIQTSTEKHDPLNDELARLNKSQGFTIGFKAPRMSGRPLDQGDYVQYQQTVGQETKAALQDLISSPRYQALSDPLKVRAIKNIEHDTTEGVTDDMHVSVELKAVGLPDVSAMPLPDDLKHTLISRLKTRIDTKAYKDKADPERKLALKQRMIDVLQNYRGTQ